MSSSDGAGLLRVPDCRYFMRNGRCRYGKECFYQHPPTRTATSAPRNSGKSSSTVSTAPTSRTAHNDRTRSYYSNNNNTANRYIHEYSNGPRNLNAHEHNNYMLDSPTSTECCRMFFTTGTCKYGSKCKFHHNSAQANIHLNSSGLPIRPGERECTHFIEKGTCRFGMGCKFHHPEPMLTVFRPPVPAHLMPRPGPCLGPLRPNYIPGPSGSLQPQPQCNNHIRPCSEVVQSCQGSPMYNNGTPCSEVIQVAAASLPPIVNPNNGPLQTYNSNGVISPYPCHNNGINGYAPQPHEHGRLYNNGSHVSPDLVSPQLPRRPGEPDCKFYLKTGVCRYGTKCVFNHPSATLDPFTQILASKLSPMGLPLRPGETICSYYIRNGICKFGPACKFDHPFPPPRKSSSHNLTENGSTSSPNISETSCATTDTETTQAN